MLLQHDDLDAGTRKQESQHCARWPTARDADVRTPLRDVDALAHVEPLFSGTLNRDLILGRWDDLLRVAGSVKMGWVTASLLIGKLQSYRRQNALMRAVQEYRRPIKTIHQGARPASAPLDLEREHRIHERSAPST